MNSIDKLVQIFSHFPGIGPRQARRFVYYLLTRSPSTINELASLISSLKNAVTQCVECRRFFEKRHANGELCDICAGSNRDKSLLMIVQRDIDLESIEKSGTFNGLYFVLGGSVPILEKEPEKRIRIKELELRIKEDKDIIKEIILGMNFNPEGENTGDYIRRQIEETLRQAQGPQIRISNLGKGLSMGAELEYTDPETLKNALKNRS